ncbi:hypothetical protein EYF80_033268 [Liparis tanakae]|uniref:Uncharacterized protein n=1 Tax=Liparis tanakae TaxID=230148 RepID=A0A4Z2GUX7_9TELE|nr:hypothetical protein EYF80_033268 [Liparis tanakae]
MRKQEVKDQETSVTLCHPSLTCCYGNVRQQGTTGRVHAVRLAVAPSLFCNRGQPRLNFVKQTT